MALYCLSKPQAVATVDSCLRSFTLLAQRQEHVRQVGRVVKKEKQNVFSSGWTEIKKKKEFVPCDNVFSTH